MPARQGKVRIVMIETVVGAAPRVAGQASLIFIDITAHATMLFIGFGIDMAGDAHKLSVIGRVIVAFGTLSPLPRMFPAIDREKAIMLIKVRRHPSQIGSVAFCTTRCKICTLVIGVQRTFIVRLVTGETVGGGTGKRSRGMALGTICNTVPFFQWEEPVIDAFGRPIEAILPVALHTIDRKARSLVIGVGRGIVIVQVAIQTFVTDPGELQGRFRQVAIIAGQCRMSTQKREAIVVMQLRYVVHQPILRRMATGTVRPDSSTVHIRMAGNTLGTGLREYKGLVALPAIYPHMLPLKPESSGVVVKRKGIGIDRPTERRVTVGTTDLKISTVRGLRLQARDQPQE